MDMVADMKSQEVACRQYENEHRIRLHNLNQLDNFRDLKYQERLDLVCNLLNKILGNKQYDVELITPRPNARFFESLAIVSFPTTGHKYKFEKEFSIFRRKNPTFKLTCSRTKMAINKSDRFESEEEMKAQIKLHHDNTLKNTTNAHKDHTPLSDNQVNGIQMNLKQLKGPNRSY